MSRNQFRIVDCAQSELPRYKEGFKKPEDEFAVAFGIIGGASTPCIDVFQEIPNEDITVSLI